MADRRDLQEGIQKARPWILPKVTEVTKVTGKEISRVQLKKKKERGRIQDQGISQEPKMINDTERKKKTNPGLSD